VRTPDLNRPNASRGRIDKREAILEAAFAVFSREGYSQACVQVIAAEANVAKPTIYNHMRDKESLFREALTAAADREAEKGLAVLERLRDGGDDVRTVLEDVGHLMLRQYCDQPSWALRRLLCAEITRFPDLFDIVQRAGTNRVSEAIADRMARLSLSGSLDTNAPDLAAEQFLSLLTGPVASRSRWGTRPLSDTELREVVRSAVDTFLRAYGPNRSAGA
jgi:AcrR family transcriptional regulator